MSYEKDLNEVLKLLHQEIKSQERRLNEFLEIYEKTILMQKELSQKVEEHEVTLKKLVDATMLLTKIVNEIVDKTP